MNLKSINYHDASKWYNRVLEIFHFDRSRDVIARDRLFQTRQKFPIEALVDQIQQSACSKMIVAIGSGPSLTAGFPHLYHHLSQDRSRYFILTADGASSPFIAHNLWPDLVVSDLDGLVPDQFHALMTQQIPLLIHAHGDNLAQLDHYQWLLAHYPLIIGTTQVEPKFPIINPGGFTDGDRGLYFLHQILPLDQPFYLFGYDFGEVVGRYSKPYLSQDEPMSAFKHQKLLLCQDLLHNLQSTEHRPLFVLPILKEKLL